jgi:L-ascorbate metabolism protein UlaG (beta-lactamase superfamily)
MKITKFIHSCLLVEMPEPVNRTALFDPGVMSEEALQVNNLEFLDDIIITHGHPDHLSMDMVQKLVAKFPKVRITAPAEVVEQLKAEGIEASSEPSDGIAFFDSPHEDVSLLFPQPQEIGVHYLDLLTDPGDSHSFSETKRILALPVTAPWGANIKAINLALELKPEHIIPIHDWHWSDAARAGSYDIMEKVFKDKADITFHKMETGQPIVIES